MGSQEGTIARSNAVLEHRARLLPHECVSLVEAGWKSSPTHRTGLDQILREGLVREASEEPGPSQPVELHAAFGIGAQGGHAPLA